MTNFASNAISLEQITSRYPDSGTLITFFQFLFISLHGLPKQVAFSQGRFPFPRLKTRKIPLTPYLIQVALFYVVSLLNNAAFGYQIPMPVHIIFRSGGLIVGMILGRLIVGKRWESPFLCSIIVVYDA
jgi:UDP-xylose/UDP-N-acetylglucosamine transporter B4